jgi:hypothetical protein
MPLTGITRQIEAQSRARARRYEAEYLMDCLGVEHEPWPVAKQLIAEVIGDLNVGKYLPDKAPPLFEDIVRAVVEATRIAPAKIHGRSRHQRVAFARQLAMYLMRQITRASYPRIGDFFSRHHSTVMYACVSMRVRLPLEPEARRALDRIATIFSAECRAERAIQDTRRSAH